MGKVVPKRIHNHYSFTQMSRCTRMKLFLPIDNTIIDSICITSVLGANQETPMIKIVTVTSALSSPAILATNYICVCEFTLFRHTFSNSRIFAVALALNMVDAIIAAIFFRLRKSTVEGSCMRYICMFS